MPSPTQITVSQLFRLIGTPKAPHIIDVCIDDDFNMDPRLIPSAVRCSYSSCETLVTQLKSKHVVIICQKGLKLSQGVAALLRTHGIYAESLEGGNFAWRDKGFPLIPVSKLPPLEKGQTTLWVTKQRPKVDKIACAWLIRRFVDPEARFLFTSASEVINVSEKFSGVPFDVENTFWGHRGEQCTFDTMLSELDLETDALLRLAKVVRGADTDRLDLSPQSAGLLAASLGLSRLHSNDLDQLEAGLTLYDAFYLWSRDAKNETHKHIPIENNK
ncbi:MAG: chromate resistance protein ChrB domain-containing protein [Cellvibrionaceae bacterium]